MKNFDFVAPFYDMLSSLVFGKAMHSAQTRFLRDIVPGANVLILGGGTGWLLAELLAINPTCKVWYIEASSKMIKLSKKKVEKTTSKVIFIHGTENSLPEGIVFDAVITHFFFDLFSTQECKQIISTIRPTVHANTIWLITDFVKTTWWHGAMLEVMYRFFSVVSGIKANSLSEWESVMEQVGFIEVKSQRTYGKFIKSTLFSLVARNV